MALIEKKKFLFVGLTFLRSDLLYCLVFVSSKNQFFTAINNCENKSIYKISFPLKVNQLFSLDLHRRICKKIRSTFFSRFYKIFGKQLVNYPHSINPNSATPIKQLRRKKFSHWKLSDSVPTLELPKWSKWPIDNFLWKFYTFVTVYFSVYSSDF